MNSLKNVSQNPKAEGDGIKFFAPEQENLTLKIFTIMRPKK